MNKTHEERKTVIVAYIRRYFVDHGFAPSYREIASGTGSCLQVVTTVMQQLRADGKIEMIGRRWRMV